MLRFYERSLDSKYNIVLSVLLNFYFQRNWKKTHEIFRKILKLKKATKFYCNFIINFDIKNSFTKPLFTCSSLFFLSFDFVLASSTCSVTSAWSLNPSQSDFQFGLENRTPHWIVCTLYHLVSQQRGRFRNFKINRRPGNYVRSGRPVRIQLINKTDSVLWCLMTYTRTQIRHQFGACLFKRLHKLVIELCSVQFCRY